GGDLKHQRDGVRDRYAPAMGFHHLPQVVPFDELERNEMESLVLAKVVDAGDVVVVESGGSACFLLEPKQILGIGGEIRGKDLECDNPTQVEVASAEHCGHTASAYGFDQLEMAQSSAGKRFTEPWIERGSARLV